MWPLILGGAAVAGGAWLLLRKPAPAAGTAAAFNAANAAQNSARAKLGLPALTPPPAQHPELVMGSASNLASFADPANMVPVDYNGETWLVSSEPIGPVGIGEALKLAQSLGLDLPSPGLVDAIWRAADLKIVPPIRASDGTPRTMSTPAVFADQENRINALIAGRPFTLLAGTHKDVVRGDAQSFSSSGGSGLKPGAVGLYGWHSEVPVPGVPLHAPVTAGVGKVIQQPFGGHGMEWKDYAQSLRLVRKAV